MRKHPALPSLSLIILFVLLADVLFAMDIKEMKTYYDNGKLHERYSYFDDEWGSIWKHGPYTSWNGAGLIESVGQYDFNSQDGPWTNYDYVYEDFVTYKLVVSSVEQGNYEGSPGEFPHGKVGIWTVTPVRVDGLQGKYEYPGGGNVPIRQREQRKYLNGFPRFDETCENKEGHWLCTKTEYYSSDSGKISSLSWDEFTGGKIVRHWEGRHVNGTKSYSGLEYNGGRQGRWSSWYDTGRLERQTDYLNDQKHGLEIAYSSQEGSQAKTITEYNYGAKQGDEKSYADGGSLAAYHRYVAGVQEGEQLDYWGDLAPGILWRKYFAKGGVGQGLDEWYYQSGAIDSRYQRVGGKIDGIALRFYESGAIM